MSTGKTIIRNLLLGKDQIESRSEYKYALLRAQLGVLLASICFIYIFIDLFSSVFVYIPWYLAGIGLSMLVIIINRRKNYMVSSIIFLITANLLVFLIASLEASQGGAFFYFVATSITGLVLFNPLNRTLGIVFVGFSIFLAALAYFGEGLPINAPAGDENYEKISFTVNFLLGIISAVIVLLFVMRRNQESESSLISKQSELQNLAYELEISKNRYALALDGTEAGIYEFDANKNKFYISSRFKRLLGFHRTDKLNLTLDNFHEIIHKHDRLRSLSIIRNALKKGSSYQFEVRLKHQSGKYRWFLNSGIVSRDGDTDESILAVGSIIDIHDRKLAENELRKKNVALEKANKELDRFVYSASHDMRAPLSTMLGLLNLAKITKDKHDLEELHDMMTNRIYTMEGFIKEVTDYSRNSRLKVTPTRVNLGQLTEEIIQTFDFLALESDVDIQVSSKIDFDVMIDKERLKVVLNNLISNAIKYHDPKKKKHTVRIDISFEDGKCCIRVEDNGMGIPEEYQMKIYDMFFRASEESQGSGLGLYIVKETVDKLHGEIKCTSTLGKGSAFQVNIPSVAVP